MASIDTSNKHADVFIAEQADHATVTLVTDPVIGMLASGPLRIGHALLCSSSGEYGRRVA